MLIIRSLFIALVGVLCGCQHYTTHERAAGQPTMNDLMHRRVNEQQKVAAEQTLLSDRAKRLTAEEAAQLEAQLRASPDDEELHSLLYQHYFFKKDVPNQS